MIIYWKKVLRNVAENKVKSTEGGFKLGAQTHLQWRLNGTDHCVGVWWLRLEAKGIPRSMQVTRSPAEVTELWWEGVRVQKAETWTICCVHVNSIKNAC